MRKRQALQNIRISWIKQPGNKNSDLITYNVMKFEKRQALQNIRISWIKQPGN